MGMLSSLLSGGAFKLSIVFFIVGALIMMLMGKLRKVFTKSKKKSIFYAIAALIIFALTALLSSSKVLDDTPLNSFFGFQFIFLGLGTLHVYTMRRFFEDFSKNKSDFFTEFLFTIVIICIGLIGFYNVANRMRPSFSLIYMASVITFIIPIIFYKLYEFALLIPVPVYKKWLYPIDENIKDPTQKELTNPLVISFEFQKYQENDNITNFRVKAPEIMEFGKLFYFFINDYNERHPESKIEYLDNENQEPCGWIFYFKPNWWSSIRHIDFSRTVISNNLKEDNVVICKRIEDDNT
ncbi:MAG: TssN family type VI secretion system protein [Flavobacteriaceae bacterium]|nr:TssN family type VI secretion system protein [Flavobacteriaceae bacterium]